MNLRQTVLAGRVRDAIAEHLHVAGDHRAAGIVVMTPTLFPNRETRDLQGDPWALRLRNVHLYGIGDE